MLRMKSFAADEKGDTHKHTLGPGLRGGIKQLLAGCTSCLCVITRFRNVVPEGRVKLVLRLYDFGEQSCLAFFIKRGISTESEIEAFIFVRKKKALKKYSTFVT